MTEIKVRFNEHNVERDLVKKAKGFLFDFMVNVQKEARKRAPVDTGHLRAHINLVPLRPATKISVISMANYSNYLEYGTIYQKAQPYMRPSLKVVKARDTKKLLKKYDLK